MKVDIMTLFPDRMNEMLHESILGRASAKGLLDISCVQIRDYTENKQRQVDDYPYGGGCGCVMMAQPLKSCLEAVKKAAADKKSRVIYMSPQGKTFNQQRARELVRDYNHLVLICGHYEGVDERFIEECIDEEISIGDFVLTGGEIAAMAVCDSVCRMVPDVLSSEECYTGESHWDGLLEYPQYTRPEVWQGRSVPEVLKGGNHAEIEHWRRKMAILRTRSKRPDMFEKLELSERDAALLAEIERDERRPKITKPVAVRKALAADLPNIMKIRGEASTYLRKNRIDQWQGDYPNEESFLKDIQRGELYVLTHGEDIAAFFALMSQKDENYDSLTDGKWRSGEDEYLSLHRLAVSSALRGSEVSRHAMDFAEKTAKAMGAHVLRGDTHKKNKAMAALFKASGYKYCGNIEIKTEPGHDPRRQAFEKLI